MKNASNEVDIGWNNLKVIKVEYINNHWMDLGQILIFGLGNQTNYVTQSFRLG